MATHPGRDYAVIAMYSVAEDAWHLELEFLREQRTLAVAVVPDEDPAREPTVSFDPQERCPDVPFEVLRWFVEQVEEEIRTSRAWMRLRPELVEVVHRLRREHAGAVEDADFPGVLARLRDAVAAPDLPAVLAAAFGRGPDGSELSGGQALRIVEEAAAAR
ncbi:hypothetical protein [Kitasatospora sp. NPDC085464]|uniref:hypothetical protein n=1 Tax=Kitasatospora sp. NPDC085464 TaxID=3364063 RepID=UPI0037CA3B62